jgi:hypothetical protein
MAQWTVENKHSGAGREFVGEFSDAVKLARSLCSETWHCFTVWAQPDNRKVAEVRIIGEPTWIQQNYRHLVSQ